MYRRIATIRNQPFTLHAMFVTNPFQYAVMMKIALLMWLPLLINIIKISLHCCSNVGEIGCNIGVTFVEQWMKKFMKVSLWNEHVYSLCNNCIWTALTCF